MTTQEIIEVIKGLSVLELNDLVKACEEEFGVSAAAGVVVAAAGADGAGVHTPVCARHESDFESLGFYEMPQTGRTEGSDGLNHFRGQFHLLVDLLFAHRRIQLVHLSSPPC